MTARQGAIIAVGSVVLGDLPADALVASNPVEADSHRFSAPTAAAWQQLGWWNSPDEEIPGNPVSLVHSIGRSSRSSGEPTAHLPSERGHQRVDGPRRPEPRCSSRLR
jgi:hypothetical protein